MTEQTFVFQGIVCELCESTECSHQNSVADLQTTESLKPKPTSILQKYSSENGDLAYFHADTLPTISNEYDYNQVYAFGFVNEDDSNSVANIKNHSDRDRSKVNDLESDFGNSGSNSHVNYKRFTKEVTVSCLSSYEDLLKVSHKLRLQVPGFSKYDGELTAGNVIPDAKKKRRIVAVKCLETMDELMQKAKAQGLKFRDSSEISDPEDSTAYEVDFILEDKIKKNQKYYLVKWKNYDLATNSWEPVLNLTGCKEMISYYETLKSSSDDVNRELFLYFIKDLTARKPCDTLTLIKLLNLITSSSESYYQGLYLNNTQLKYKAREFLDIPWFKLRKFNKQLLEIMQLAEKRKLVLVRLKEWEIEINSFNPNVYIEVENNVDLEPPPTDFQFVHDYMSSDIPISEEPVTFCNCNNCYEDKRSCCATDSEAHFAYNKFKRLQLLPGYPIYECNKLCKCGKDCVNRVVQLGQRVKVTIFRTSTDKGWGLKAQEIIQKDQFVCEYLGEIITSDEAENRGRIYDYVGRSYLFDLDYGEENCKYTVDAGHVGNSSHFINHSCNPNLHVFAVWINNQDPNIPRLAFFAKRKISRGEELTFDYKMVKSHERLEPRAPVPEAERFPCKCNSHNCKKYLF